MIESSIDTATINRINKLLALANNGGATEAEAELAMSKAQEIMNENNLTMAMMEASGTQQVEGRAKEENDGQAQYPYQRNIMTVLCEVNYCYTSVIYGGKRGRASGYRIIGRQSNVVAVQTMFEYLMTTINRLVLNEIGDYRQRMSRFAMSWCEGCSERLVHRIRVRHNEYLLKQKKDADAKTAQQKHNGGNQIVIYMTDHVQNEADLNTDFRMGRPPGTTAQRRMEEKARKEARKSEGIKLGLSGDALHYFLEGYTAEQVEKIMNPDEAEIRKREKYWAKHDRRQENKERDKMNRRDWTGYSKGQNAGNSIGLDGQIERSAEQKRIE